MRFDDVIGPADLVPAYNFIPTDVVLLAGSATQILTYNPRRIAFGFSPQFAFGSLRVWPTEQVSSSTGFLMDFSQGNLWFDWETYSHLIQLDWYGFSSSGSPTLRMLQLEFDPGKFAIPDEIEVP